MVALQVLNVHITKLPAEVVVAAVRAPVNAEVAVPVIRVRNKLEVMQGAIAKVDELSTGAIAFFVLHFGKSVI